MVSAVAALILRYSEISLSFGIGSSGACFSSNSTSDDCSSSNFAITLCKDNSCSGYFAVFRVSFTLASFFLLMLLWTACRTRSSTKAHRGYWLFKLAIVAGVFVGSIFAPNDMLAYYAWFARFIAPIFMLYQMIMFIDFGYRVNETLVAKDEQLDNFLCCNNEGFRYKGTLVFLSAVLFICSIVGTVLLYIYFPSGGCPVNGLVISLNLILFILNTAISVSSLCEHGALFTSALISAYTTWLAFSALSSWPDEECNQLITSDSDVSLIISIVIAGLSLGYIAFMMGKKQLRTTPKAAANDTVTVHVDATPGDEIEPESFWSYHLVMFAVSVYMAMLLTDWGVHQDPEEKSTKRYNVGYASAWLQAGASWACSFLYMLTLLLPRLCPNRDFS